MIKLLLCLVSAVLIAVAMLQLRDQKRELNYQISQYHSQIESRQAKLWSQQLQIAIYTAPNAISKTVGDQDLKLAPPKVVVPGQKPADPSSDPHAE